MDTTNESVQNQASFTVLRQSKSALLTSFRRNGQEVGTLVGLTVVGNKAYFTTWSTTGKIKRLANNPRVTLAPCTRQGKLLGPTVEGTARRLEGVEAKEARKHLGGTLRFWMWALIYKLAFRAQPVLYEVVPEPLGERL